MTAGIKSRLLLTRAIRRSRARSASRRRSGVRALEMGGPREPRKGPHEHAGGDAVCRMVREANGQEAEHERSRRSPEPDVLMEDIKSSDSRREQEMNRSHRLFTLPQHFTSCHRNRRCHPQSRQFRESPAPRLAGQVDRSTLATFGRISNTVTSARQIQLARRRNLRMVSMNWLTFVAGAVLSWGVYGAMLHQGQVKLGNPMRALLCVGIAYFLVECSFRSSC